MNISTIYDKSIKMIDESYSRLLRIWELPRGSISKKRINNHNYYYLQYRNGNKIFSRLLKKDELVVLRKQVNERKKLIKENKLTKSEIQRNIKIISLFDKGLSTSLMDEMFAYSFDEIPVKERDKVNLPFVNVVETSGDNRVNINENLKDYFGKWKKGEIRARDISNYIIQKISD